MQTVHNFSREDGGSIIAIFGHNWQEMLVMAKQAQAKSTGPEIGNYCIETQYPGTGSGAPFTCWYTNLIHPPPKWIKWKEAKMTLKLK